MVDITVIDEKLGVNGLVVFFDDMRFCGLDIVVSEAADVAVEGKIEAVPI